MTRHLFSVAFLVAIVGLGGCGSPQPPPPKAPTPTPLRPATPIADDTDVDQHIKDLEAKAKTDPKDFETRNQLVGYYLTRLGADGNLDSLAQAAKAVHESLAIAAADKNPGGVRALMLVEFASHDFAAAREHANQLHTQDDDDLGAVLVLADALVETGDYEGANSVIADINKRGASSAYAAYNAQIRLARAATLGGRLEEAAERYRLAIEAATKMSPLSRDALARCYWQLGELAFSVGRYDEAEARYADALTTYPGYHRALASMARVLAAKGDLAGAIAKYEGVVKDLPEPIYLASLGDLYALSGRQADADAQFKLVEKVANANDLNRVVYDRQLVLFWADHDKNADQAYTRAKNEYDTRKDIYGADAFAWAAFKAGKIPEAQEAMKAAMRLGTQDPKLFFHAGMIAKAGGDQASAALLLGHALELSPVFDPVLAKKAKEALGT